MLVDFALNNVKIKSIPYELGNIRIYNETITSSKGFREKYDREKERLYYKVYNKRPLKIIQRLLFHYYRFLKIIKSPEKFISFLKNKVANPS